MCEPLCNWSNPPVTNNARSLLIQHFILQNQQEMLEEVVLWRLLRSTFILVGEQMCYGFGSVKHKLNAFSPFSILQTVGMQLLA